MRLNETLDEHDVQMDSSPPQNVLAGLHQENEREEESAKLPTSRSSSNSGRENAVGTVCTAHHGGGGMRWALCAQWGGGL